MTEFYVEVYEAIGEFDDEPLRDEQVMEDALAQLDLTLVVADGATALVVGPEAFQAATARLMRDRLMRVDVVRVPPPIATLIL